jgi:tetratricopeptide (TPR) repeat protein
MTGDASSAPARSLIEQASRLLASAAGSEELLRLAVTAFTAAVEKLPATPAAYYGRGTALDRLRRHDEAAADFDRAVQLAPNDPMSRAMRAYHRRSHGDLEGALEDLDHAINAGREIVAVRLERARVRSALGNSSGAVIDYEEALEDDPRSIVVQRETARLLASLGRLREAAAHYEAAIALDDDEPETHRNWADLAASLGDSERALVGYKAALIRNPEMVSAKVGVAKALSALGRHEEAIEAADRALGVDPGLTEALRVRALGLVKLDRDEEALPDLDRLVELGDDTGEVRLLRAQARLARGEEDSAVSDLHAAVARTPTTADQFLERACRQRDAGDAAAALPDFEAAAALDPRNPAAYAGRGQALLALGEPQRAMLEFERALELDPSQREALEGLVVAHFHHGDRYAGERTSPHRRDAYLSALLCAKEAGKQMDGDPVFAGYEAAALRLLKAYDNAAERAQAALDRAENWPASVVGWLAREAGDAFRQWGKISGQRDTLELALDRLERVLDLSDDRDERALALELQGHCFVALKRPGEALVRYRRARREQPDAVWSLLGMGRVELSVDEPGAALETFDAALARKPAGQILDWVQTGRWLALRLTGADGEEAGTAALGECTARAHLDRAERLEWLGAPQLALDDRRRALELSPDDVNVLNSLAWYVAEHRAAPEDLPAAHAYAARALALLEPGDPLDTYVYDTAGWIARQLGHRDEALAYLEHAVALDPYPFLPRWHLEQAKAAVPAGAN